jgi:hypothetical protein
MCEGKTPDARRQTLHARLALKRDKARTCVSGVWRLASLALLAAACTANPAAPTTTTIAATSVPTTTVVPAAWVWGIDSVELGGGYAVGPCEGDADQIACVTKDDVVVGSAEFLSLPTESFDFLDGVVDPVESIALIAADYIATFQTDRQTTCPNLEFKTLAEVPVTVAGGGGLRYGFEELDGVQVVEKNLIYGVRIGENINLYSFAAIAEGACLSNEGELTDPAILDALLPGLDRVMALVESG